MKAKEIFDASVKVMKDLLTSQGMMASISRARIRGEAGNQELLAKERENVNELTRKISRSGGRADALDGVSEHLVDAMVLRYLRNREVFMKTFPDGIENIGDDPLLLWAAIMVSPLDERDG